MFWDANRQAIHDRIVGTVVVLDGAPKVPNWEEALVTRRDRFDTEALPDPEAPSGAWTSASSGASVMNVPDRHNAKLQPGSWSS